MKLLAATTSKLAKLGCAVERAAPPKFDFELAWKTYGQLLGSELSPALPLRLRALFGVLFMTSGRPAIDRGILAGMGMTRTKYMRILAVREELIEQMDHFMKPWDALLCPVSTGPAFTHRRTGTRIEVDDQTVPYMMGAGACTTLFNLLGNPVVVVPLTRSSLGLPLGMQVVGARWKDMELLDIAEKIMEVTGPVQRPTGWEKP
ncbi:MAG: amidase family protein [Gemmatales bacterium]